MSDFASKPGHIDPNGTNLILRSVFSAFWLGESKYTANWSSKFPDLSHLGPIWPNMDPIWSSWLWLWQKLSHYLPTEHCLTVRLMSIICLLVYIYNKIIAQEKCQLALNVLGKENIEGLHCPDKYVAWCKFM